MYWVHILSPSGIDETDSGGQSSSIQHDPLEHIATILRKDVTKLVTLNEDNFEVSGWLSEVLFRIKLFIEQKKGGQYLMNCYIGTGNCESLPSTFAQLVKKNTTE